MDWIEHNSDEIWDYEKVFYAVKLKDGTETYVWPNAGHLTDISFGDNSGNEIPVSDVVAYREDEDAYFKLMDLNDD